MQCCRLYCTFCFALISNVTFFGNSMEFTQIDHNSQQVVLCFSGNNVTASINDIIICLQEQESCMRTRFQNSQTKI